VLLNKEVHRTILLPSLKVYLNFRKCMPTVWALKTFDRN